MPAQQLNAIHNCAKLSHIKMNVWPARRLKLWQTLLIWRLVSGSAGGPNASFRGSQVMASFAFLFFLFPLEPLPISRRFFFDTRASLSSVSGFVIASAKPAWSPMAFTSQELESFNGEQCWQTFHCAWPLYPSFGVLQIGPISWLQPSERSWVAD